MNAKDLLYQQNKQYNKSPEEMTTQELLADSADKIVSLYNRILSSITREDIKKLSPRDRIWALQKLSHVHDITKGSKRNVYAFNNFNVQNASREELETEMLRVAEQ